MKKQINVTSKIIITFGLVVLSAMAAIAQNSGEFPVPLSDPAKRGKLRAHLNSGSIYVKGTARKDVLVKYSSTSNDNNEDHKASGSTKDGLKKISAGTMDLEVSENDNVVKAGSDSWNNPIKLEIEVPIGFDLEVKAYNDGDIFINNIQGEVVLTNYNGEITAENISGSCVANTYNGEIRVTFDKVTEGAPMSYSTYNGDIDLTLPATVKATLKMKTEQGEIFSGFDVSLMKGGPITKKEEGRGTKIVIDEWVKGDINGGGPEFTMKTFNGDIKIRKK